MSNTDSELSTETDSDDCRTLPDGPTEDSTCRDGVLSYAGEWHALFLGMGLGFGTVVPLPKLKRFAYRAAGLDPEMNRTRMLSPTAWEEVKAESWYALGGLLCGVAFGLLVDLVLATVVVSSAGGLRLDLSQLPLLAMTAVVFGVERVDGAV